jgi:hypothetical protein
VVFDDGPQAQAAQGDDAGESPHESGQAGSDSAPAGRGGVLVKRQCSDTARFVGGAESRSAPQGRSQ